MPPEIPFSVVEALRRAEAVAVLTGAGISAESGVPTFRDAQTGLWAQYRPEELATPQAFRRDPGLVWEWYQWRRELVRGAAPNAGHYALAALEAICQQGGRRFTLITQNVDGLHGLAGSRNLIELHGNLTRTSCSVCERPAEAWPAEGPVPPRCSNCGGPLRPAVVWFNEALPREALAAALEAAQSCAVFLSVGTSGLVEPAASLPLEALRRRAVVVEVNVGETPLTRQATAHLRGPAGEVLPALVAALGAP